MEERRLEDVVIELQKYRESKREDFHLEKGVAFYCNHLAFMTSLLKRKELISEIDYEVLKQYQMESDRLKELMAIATENKSARKDVMWCLDRMCDLLERIVLPKTREPH